MVPWTKCTPINAITPANSFDGHGKISNAISNQQLQQSVSKIHHLLSLSDSVLILLPFK